jgi:hypothetical protein
MMNSRCYRKLILFLFFLAVVSLPSRGQEHWNEFKKIYPEPFLQAAGTEFGYQIAMNDDYIVATSYLDDEKIVHVFANDGSYDTLATLRSSVPDPAFGKSLAIHGNTIVVGGNYTDIKGAAYVFVKPENGWKNMTETAVLRRSNTEESKNFGTDVAIHGDMIVVPDYLNSEYEKYGGAVYVFQKPDGGWVDTTETAELMPSDLQSYTYFGKAVDCDDNTIVVGATGSFNGHLYCGAVYVFDKPAGGWKDTTETAMLLASDAEERDYLGKVVAIDNNTIVAGAHQDDDHGSESGAVYVFTKLASGWTDTTETAKITPSDASERSYFGTDVDIFMDTLVVGASTESAYLFVKSDTGWTGIKETAIFKASDNRFLDRFGYAVDIHNTTVIVGAYGADGLGSSSGALYIFKKQAPAWESGTETAKLLPFPRIMNYSDHYGASVAIGNDYFVVGSPGRYVKTGAVYVYSAHYPFPLLATLTPSDSKMGKSFGAPVDIDIETGTVVAGAVDDTVNGYMSGSAYVFVKPEDGWKDMTETAKLIPSEGADNDDFGCAVAINRGIIAIGAKSADYQFISNSGAVYVYEKPETGWRDTVETAKLTDPDQERNFYFGSQLDVDSSGVIAASTWNDVNGNNSGAVLLFENDGGSWSNIATLTPSDAGEGDYFGKQIKFDGDILAISSNDSVYGLYSGAVYIFEKPGTGWTDMNEAAKLIPSDGAESDYFGFSMSISGDYLVAGAPYDNDHADKTGSLYFFEKPATGWENMTETQKITASDWESNEYYSTAVAVSDQLMIAGAKYADDKERDVGSAYLYTPCVSFFTMDTSTCSAFVSPSGRYTWTESGIHKDTIFGTGDCFTEITVNLSLFSPTSSSIDTVVCLNYTPPSGKYIYTTSGVFHDTISNTNGCDSIITINIVIPEIDTAITITNGSLVSKTPGASYQWLVCDQDNYIKIPGETNQSFVPDSQASYAVEVILTGCRDTSACYAFDNTGIAAILGDESFVLYPNPTDGDITISFNEKQQDITIQAVNMMGELISEKNYKNVYMVHYQIHEANGIYILKLMNANEMKAIIKVIKN